MSDIVELLRRLVQVELDRRLPSHIGVVENVTGGAGGTDTQNYGCDVRLRGRDLVLTGVPIAADHLATVTPPAKGDVVLLHFVGGDPDQPVIGGRLFSEALRPPVYDLAQSVTWLPPDAGDNDRVELLLAGGKNGSRTWSLTMPPDLSITVTDKKVEAKVGPFTVTVDGDGGEATIKSSGSTITAKDGGDVTISGNGNLTLDAKGNVEIKAGGNLKLNASGTAELKGSVVNLN